MTFAADPGRDPVVLVEHCDSEMVAMAPSEYAALSGLAPSLQAIPAVGKPDHYSLNPHGLVGVVEAAGRRFELRPKLPIRRLLFLLSYSMDPKNWRRLGFDFEADVGLFEAVVPGFAFQLEEALRRGPLLGYRIQEDALQTVRGRIRFDDQLRSRFGLLPPMECRFDEFTEDIEINRLLKASIAALGRMRIRDADTRRRLRVLSGAFGGVAAVVYDPRAIPEVRYNRMSEHFRRPTELARLILKADSPDNSMGDVGGAAFLLDLATVFEDFVVVALREALGVRMRQFPQQAKGKNIYLDERRRLRLKPDLSWWANDRCVFVGDVKYKKTTPSGGVGHPDLYQLLAYTTATELSTGMLIYAAGAEEPGAYRVPTADKVIEVRAIDLNQEPAEVLIQIRDIAAQVRKQASEQTQAIQAMGTAGFEPATSRV